MSGAGPGARGRQRGHGAGVQKTGVDGGEEQSRVGTWPSDNPGVRV